MRIVERISNAWRGFRATGPVNAPAAHDDSWYGSNGYKTATGLKVSPESALRVAAVFACTRVVSETVASLPLIIYKRLKDGGKERATDHPLYNVLHNKPNQWQTAYEWLEMMQAHLELRGNSFSVIVPGPKAAIDQLVPIHPDRVQVFRMADGRLKYQVRNFFNAETKYYMQEEMLHFRSMSFDGLVGMSTVAIMSEAIASGLASQEYAGRFFENGASPSGVFTAPKALTDAQFERYKKSIRESQTGENAHKVMVLEEGMTFTAIGISNKDSQLLEARQFSRGDIASGFRVPPHKIGDLSRATFSNIEQQNIEFATDSIRPRLVRVERRIQCDLIDPLDLQDGNEYFCEFLMDALLRGDMKSRYESYAIGRQWGWLSVNRICSMENMNPIGPEGDKYLVPLNMVNAGEDPTDLKEIPPAEDSTNTGARVLPGSNPKQLGDGTKARLREFAVSAAERLVRKEVKAIQKLAERHANEEFSEELANFYEEHAKLVSASMQMSAPLASSYTDGHKAYFIKFSVDAALLLIERIGAEELASLALEEMKNAQAAPPAINITMPPQTIQVQLPTPEPRSGTESQGKRTVVLRRDGQGRVEKAEIEYPKKIVSMTRDHLGRIEKVDLD